MNTIAEETVNRLAQIDYFANVGSPVRYTIDSCDLTYVQSWREAVRLRGGDSASNAFCEGSGLLTRKLSAEFRKEYRQWNVIVRENRDLFDRELFPMFDDKVDAISELNDVDNGSQLIKLSFRWDAIHFAAEQAYARFVSPAFYSRIFDIYRAGHFPCNWNEQWPDGVFWIF